jgi:hypothetical protein
MIWLYFDIKKLFFCQIFSTVSLITVYAQKFSIQHRYDGASLRFPDMVILEDVENFQKNIAKSTM